MRLHSKKKSKFSRLVILPYKQGSASARKLADLLTHSLGVKVRRVRPDGPYRPKLRSLVLNYGSNALPHWFPANGLNKGCAIAGNKLQAFQRFQQHDVRTVEWTSNRAAAQQWASEGHTVVCRTILNAHSGRGIILATTATEVVPCQLYTKYKKKKKEFRVHVFRGQVIDVSEKRRRSGQEIGFSGLVRNLSNGWVYCRDNVVRPADMDNLAISACSALGLDFGAVDIIWNEKENKSYVLEVNTAPGLEGTTLQNYANAVLQWVNQA